MVDLASMTDGELDELADAIRAEKSARYRRALFPQQVHAAIADALAAGVAPGEVCAVVSSVLPDTGGGGAGGTYGRGYGPGYGG